MRASAAGRRDARVYAKAGVSERLAVLGDRLPVELDDVAEPLGVVAPPEAEPLGADPVLVRARRPSLYLLVSLCVRITRRP
jgi:hypothetical protein